MPITACHMPLGKADLGPRRDNFLGIGAETSRTGGGWLLHHASGHPCWWPLVVLSRTGDSGGHAISRGWERLEVAGGGRGGRGGSRGGPPPPPPGGGRASDPPPRTPSSQPGGPLRPPDVLRNPQMLSKYVLLKNCLKMPKHNMPSTLLCGMQQCKILRKMILTHASPSICKLPSLSNAFTPGNVN